MEKLSIEDFLVVKKKSRLEVDAMKMGLDWHSIDMAAVKEEFSKRYNQNSDFIVRNIKAHEELYESVSVLRKLGLADIIERDCLKKDELEKKKAVIALGGDNHLMWVLDQLEFLGVSLPVIGMSSGKSSAGGLLYDSKSTIQKTVEKCRAGKYTEEQWPKIDCEIRFNGSFVKCISACQEYVLGEYVGTQMSRWVLTGKEEQKGNRLIVANGAGSSGWYNNINQGLFWKDDMFSRTNRELRYIIDGPAQKSEGYSYAKGVVADGEILEIVSYNDDKGVATADSINEARYIYEFPFGSVAKIKVSDKVSRIIKAENE